MAPHSCINTFIKLSVPILETLLCSDPSAQHTLRNSLFPSKLLPACLPPLPKTTFAVVEDMQFLLRRLDTAPANTSRWAGGKMQQKRRRRPEGGRRRGYGGGARAGPECTAGPSRSRPTGSPAEVTTAGRGLVRALGGSRAALSPCGRRGGALGERNAAPRPGAAAGGRSLPSGPGFRAIRWRRPLAGERLGAAAGSGESRRWAEPSGSRLVAERGGGGGSRGRAAALRRGGSGPGPSRARSRWKAGAACARLRRARRGRAERGGGAAGAPGSASPAPALLPRLRFPAPRQARAPARGSPPLPPGGFSSEVPGASGRWVPGPRPPSAAAPEPVAGRSAWSGPGTCPGRGTGTARSLPGRAAFIYFFFSLLGIAYHFLNHIITILFSHFAANLVSPLTAHLMFYITLQTRKMLRRYYPTGYVSFLFFFFFSLWTLWGKRIKSLSQDLCSIFLESMLHFHGMVKKKKRNYFNHLRFFW